jgi:alkyl sulfatase BDS1-like metallo-beta-lactamase superfamily hydrolase
VDQLFDSVAIMVDGPRAWALTLSIDWVFTDLGHTYRTSLSHAVLIQDVDPTAGTSDLTVTLTKAGLLGLLGGGGLAGLRTEGDTGVVASLLGVLDPPRGDLPIVTP